MGVETSYLQPPSERPQFVKLQSQARAATVEQDNVVDWKEICASSRVKSVSPRDCFQSNAIALYKYLTGHLSSFLADELSSLFIVASLFFHDPWGFIFITFLSAGSPCFFYYNYFSSDIDHSDDRRLSFNLSWTLLSTAIVFPLTMTLSETFKRREAALCQLASFKANVTSYYISHEDW